MFNAVLHRHNPTTAVTETQANQPQGFGHSPRRLAIEIGAVVVGLALIVVLAFWAASALAGVLVAYVPTSVDRALGQSAWPLVAPPPQRCTDPGPQRYVEQVAAPLLAALPEGAPSFTFTVIDRADVNASALPGGYVTVHFGLLDAIESGDELAAVLAHELSHVTERHGVVRVLRSAGGRIILGLLLGWSDVGAVLDRASSLVDVSYDRDQERDADRRGRALLKQAGIDPAALGRFFARLGDVPGALQIISTHPSHAERATAAQRDARAFTPTLHLPAPGDLRCHGP
jgi:beta-barrel assembly-enhancing protease